MEKHAEIEAVRLPRATYRLQFHEKFRLAEACALVPYLAGLGVSHIYASPLLMARPHSGHGYDTCDFSRLNPELGEEEDLQKLVTALHAYRMGMILDVVPNHMGIGGPENRWWWDVLARGPRSPFAHHFDIDWNPPDPRLQGKVLVPVLGDRYQRVLSRGEVRIENRRGEYLLRYFDHLFPLNAATVNKVAGNVEELNSSPAAMDSLLASQFYRLSWYRHGDAELNYRRFFNYAHLPGISIEKPGVFKGVLERVAEWVRRGWVDGLRVDHIDGLRDPEAFLKQLRALVPGVWIVVEKILEEDESLPAGWPVAGTTGYDFANSAAGLFIDPRGAQPLTDLYGGFTGQTAEYATVILYKKREVLRTLLAAEVGRLLGLLVRISANSWRFRDFTEFELREALVELAACFPVYRSYIQPDGQHDAESDFCFVARAISAARRHRPDLAQEVFEFLTNLFLLKQPGKMEHEFVARFQQLTGPAMAKGAEDTAFYCFNRFAALNEVGGNPGQFGTDASEFHQFCLRQQKRWPAGMLASSTHDTKRSEDVRARLSLLSEIPQPWREAVMRWSALNERHRREGMPDRNMEYLYYQTLVGAWPLPEARAVAYMQKAAQEAKEHTCASVPNAGYESALQQFVTGTLGDPDFTMEVENFVRPLLKAGCINSLAQTLLKLTAPGVPDIYQGTEVWDLSLVDPDNRRPVDFAERQEMLASAAALTAEESWKQWASGLPKLWLIQHLLKLRQQWPEWFGDKAAYEPIAAIGPARGHVVAFKRGASLITVVPRLIIGLNDDWRDTAIEMPPGNWRQEFAGRAVSPGPALIRELLRHFPVAVLTREES